MRATSFGAALVLVAACSGSSRQGDEARRDSIAECEAYVASYQACVGALGPGGARVAGERASALRAAFAPPKDEKQREALRAKCAVAQKNLVVGGQCR